MDFKIRYDKHPDAPKTRARRAREARESADTSLRMRGLAYGFSIPATLASGPVCGWLIGRALDAHYHTGFWMLTLILLGTVASLSMTVQLLLKLSR